MDILLDYYRDNFVDKYRDYHKDNFMVHSVDNYRDNFVGNCWDNFEDNLVVNFVDNFRVNYGNNFMDNFMDNFLDNLNLSNLYLDKVDCLSLILKVGRFCLQFCGQFCGYFVENYRDNLRTISCTISWTIWIWSIFYLDKVDCLSSILTSGRFCHPWSHCFIGTPSEKNKTNLAFNDKKSHFYNSTKSIAFRNL